MSSNATMPRSNYKKVNSLRSNLLLFVNRSLNECKREIYINSQSAKQIAQKYQSYQICIDNPIITGFPIRMGSRRNFKGLFTTPEQKDTKTIKAKESHKMYSITSSMKSKKCDISNKKRNNSPYNGNCITVTKQSQLKETEEEVKQSQLGFNMLQEVLMSIKGLHSSLSGNVGKKMNREVKIPKSKKKKIIEEVKDFNAMIEKDNKKPKNKSKKTDVIHLLPILTHDKYCQSDDDDDEDDEFNIHVDDMNCFDIKIQI